MKRLLLPLLLTLLGCPPPADPRLKTPPPVADALELTLTPKRGAPGGTSKLTRRDMRPDALQATPPAGASAEGLLSGRQRWSVLRIGEPENVIPFVIVGEGRGAALFIDSDRDGQLAEEIPHGNQSNADNFAALIQVPVRYASGEQPVTVWLYTSDERGRYDFYSQSSWEGTLRVEGAEFPVWTFEEECDGVYTDPLAIDVNHDGKVQASERVHLGDTVRLGNAAVTLRSISPDGSRVRFERAESDATARDLAGAVDAELTVKPFRFTDLDGRPVAVGPETRGKVVLIDFWATWCGPCMRELPHMKALYAAYGARTDFLLVGVSLDSDRAKLEQVVAEQGLSWAQHCDGQGLEGPVPQAYGVHGIPATFLIDREGRIVAEGLRGEIMVKRVGELLDR